MAFYGKQNNDYAAYLKHAVKFLLVLLYKINFLDVFLHAFPYANTGLFFFFFFFHWHYSPLWALAY
jgi:hypothetical protein